MKAKQKVNIQLNKKRVYPVSALVYLTGLRSSHWLITILWVLLGNSVGSCNYESTVNQKESLVASKSVADTIYASNTIKNNGKYQLTANYPPFLAPNTGLPSCASGGDNSIVGTIKTELNQGIEDVNVNITGSSCPTPNSCQPFDMISDIDGNYSACQICFDCNRQIITPVLDLDPTNGVNTWDLILISRHILGLEPFNTPFKLISGDANKSGSVTTFDIVELRKLILGTYTSFSQMQGGQATQKSWRFVDKNQVFTNPANPFADVIRESITLNATSLPNSQVNFIGTKIGDVDNTVAPHSKKKRPDSSLGFMANTAAKGGDIITVPVYYQGETVMDGLQFALKFDPNGWELIGPSAGDIAVVPDHFGLSKADQGSIGFSWNTT